MKFAYVDSCVWISHIEGLPEYQQIIEKSLQKLAEEGWRFCISEVVLLEVSAKPVHQKRDEIVEIYRQLFRGLRLLKTYSTVFRESLSVAQTENIKGIDAVHVAIADHYGCGIFVSSDPHCKNQRILPSMWINLNQ